MAVYFKASEFERASHRPLTLRERQKAEQFWGLLLDPIRMVVGPIRVTSYVRSGEAVGGGSHVDGSGLDIQPVIATNERIRRVAQLIAAEYLPGGVLAQVIYEAPKRGQFRAHIHLADRLVPGATGGYLEMDSAGNVRRVPYPLATEARARLKGVGIGAPAAVGAALALLSLWRSLQDVR